MDVRIAASRQYHVNSAGTGVFYALTHAYECFSH
jgi:hypothetical protein